MGLEAINFFFCTKKKESIKEIIEANNQIKKTDEKRYIYFEKDLYWIDIEIQNEFCLSIRITLCNPIDNTLNALDRLLIFLFNFNGVLNNLNTKEVFHIYNLEVKNKIINSYQERKIVFQSMYGDYTAAVSSEEFYRIQRAKRGINE